MPEERTLSTTDAVKLPVGGFDEELKRVLGIESEEESKQTDTHQSLWLELRETKKLLAWIDTRNRECLREFVHQSTTGDRKQTLMAQMAELLDIQEYIQAGE